MTRTQIQLKMSEKRQRLNELLGVETRDEAAQTELETLTGELQHLEPELRAALALEPDPDIQHVDVEDGQARELRGVRVKTGYADYLRAAASGSAVSGAAAEFAAACHVPDVGHMPMAIFPGRSQVETRAITPGPAVDGPVQPTIPYVFERSAAVSVGTSCRVSGGQVQIPKITTAPPADTLAKDGAAPSTAAAVVLDSQSPVRIAGQVRGSRRGSYGLCRHLKMPSVSPCRDRSRTSWTSRPVQRRGGRAERAIHPGPNVNAATRS